MATNFEFINNALNNGRPYDNNIAKAIVKKNALRTKSVEVRHTNANKPMVRLSKADGEVSVGYS